MLLGADNWPVEIAPNPDKAINLPVHNIALTVNGVHLLENLVLENLAKARVYEFAFVMQPLKLQGATGSTVAPTARSGEQRGADKNDRRPSCATPQRSSL